MLTIDSKQICDDSSPVLAQNIKFSVKKTSSKLLFHFNAPLFFVNAFTETVGASMGFYRKTAKPL